MGVVCCSESNAKHWNGEDEAFTRKNFLGVKTSPITQNYTFEKMLGFGAFGEVKLGRHIKSKIQVAIKKMKLNNKDKEQMQGVINEITILIKVVRHSFLQVSLGPPKRDQSVRHLQRRERSLHRLRVFS